MLPFHIETLYHHKPWANWAVLGVTAFAGLVIRAGLLMPDELAAGFVLGTGGRWTLFTHLLAHTSVVSLIVELLFLWVAGNAVCGLIGNLPFTLLYVALGCVSGLVQLAAGHQPVVGAGGAVAGMIGVCLAFFPTNNLCLYYPAGASLRETPAPLWILAVYWGAWSTLGAVFGLDPTTPWGHLAGLIAGLGIGSLLVSADWVSFTDCDNGTLLELLRRHPAPAQDKVTEDARAELRRLARAYYEEYSALPQVTVGATPAGRRRLSVRRSVGFARSASGANVTTTAPTRFGAAAAPASDAAPPVPPTEHHASVWPSDLPDVRFFHFDGTERHGPETRGEFLASLSLAADTSLWWYWAEGMHEWQRVARLDDPSHAEAALVEPAAPAVAMLTHSLPTALQH